LKRKIENRTLLGEQKRVSVKGDERCKGRTFLGVLRG